MTSCKVFRAFRYSNCSE